MSDEMPAVLTAKQAALYLSLSSQYVYLLACRKQIPYHKLGRAIRFTRADLDAWLAEHRVAALT